MGNLKQMQNLNPIGDRVQKRLKVETKELGLAAAGRPCFECTGYSPLLPISMQPVGAQYIFLKRMTKCFDRRSLQAQCEPKGA